MPAKGIESELNPSDRAKIAAARRALDEVCDGMRVGLGTGSTATWFRQIARRKGSTRTAAAAGGADIGCDGRNLLAMKEFRWLN